LRNQSNQKPINNQKLTNNQKPVNIQRSISNQILKHLKNNNNNHQYRLRILNNQKNSSLKSRRRRRLFRLRSIAIFLLIINWPRRILINFSNWNVRWWIRTNWLMRPMRKRINWNLTSINGERIFRKNILLTPSLRLRQRFWNYLNKTKNGSMLMDRRLLRSSILRDMINWYPFVDPLPLSMTNTPISLKSLELF